MLERSNPLIHQGLWKRWGVGCLVLAGIVSITGICCAADWPQWLGPNRDGSTSETVEPWKEPPKVLWRVNVGEGHGGPVVYGDRVYLHYKVDGEEKEEVLCLDANEGKVIWRQTYERPPFSNIYGNGPRSTPLADLDHLYTVSPSGLLICWDRRKGEEKWRVNFLEQFQAKNLFFGVSTSPVLDGQRLIVMVGGPEASLVAFDKDTGGVLWKSGSEPASYSSPIISRFSGRRVGFCLTQQGLVAFDPESGQRHWKFAFVDRLNESSTTPVRFGNAVFVSSVTAGSLALRLRDDGDKIAQEQLWKNGLTSYFATPVVVGDYLYGVFVSGIVNPTATLHCLEGPTGKSLWTRPNVGTYHATLIRAGNRLLLLEEGGILILIEPDPQKYRELCRAKVCGQTWAHPALSNGKLYVRDRKELLCVSLQP
ncbi:MAG: PQQ-like beta-propeller repeat protein [Gemmatales bacterium]|nr:PQQ-like beta-propeller repeat protein [Gemmatales bacterium]MDW8386624.1 PQQ-binding-like beta-propeller repeat protein [Gemmatales bacterium]